MAENTLHEKVMRVFIFNCDMTEIIERVFVCVEKTESCEEDLEVAKKIIFEKMKERFGRSITEESVFAETYKTVREMKLEKGVLMMVRDENVLGRINI